MSKFRSATTRLAMSGWALSQALVPLISGTQRKWIVCFGFGSFPSATSLM